MCGYNASSNFQLGYGSASWLVVAEMLPPTSRSTLYPFIIAYNCLCNTVLMQLYRPMLAGIGKFEQNY